MPERKWAAVGGFRRPEAMPSRGEVGLQLALDLKQQAQRLDCGTVALFHLHQLHQIGGVERRVACPLQGRVSIIPVFVQVIAEPVQVIDSLGDHRCPNRTKDEEGFNKMLGSFRKLCTTF